MQGSCSLWQVWPWGEGGHCRNNPPAPPWNKGGVWCTYPLLCNWLMWTPPTKRTFPRGSWNCLPKLPAPGCWWNNGGKHSLVRLTANLASKLGCGKDTVASEDLTLCTAGKQTWILMTWNGNHGPLSLAECHIWSNPGTWNELYVPHDPYNWRLLQAE